MTGASSTVRIYRRVRKSGTTVFFRERKQIHRLVNAVRDARVYTLLFVPNAVYQFTRENDEIFIAIYVPRIIRTL